jgi:hypothetical protein
MAHSNYNADLHLSTSVAEHFNFHLDLDVGLTPADKAIIDEEFNALMNEYWGSNQDSSFATAESETPSPVLTHIKSYERLTYPDIHPLHHVPETAVQHRCTTLLGWNGTSNTTVRSSTQSRTSSANAGLRQASRIHPYKTNRPIRPTQNTNAEAGPSTLAPPTPPVGSPTTQPSGGTSEAAADATNNQTSAVEDKAQVSHFYHPRIPRA